jgi:MHS family proline/betaine transporter-like MFS transporter
VATWLIEETGNVSMPAFYIMVCAAISAAAAFSLRESRQQPMSEEAVAA